MKLIVGLGNPGERYAKTRHNAGFMMVDFILKTILESENQSVGFQFDLDKYIESEIAKVKFKGEDIILIKSQTFMNDSGRAVKKALEKYSATEAELYIIHDDLDIQLGEFKIQKGKGPELHYGVKSIEDHLKSKDFWRIRIGVDSRDPSNRIPGETYTLQNFTTEEMEKMRQVFERILQSFLVPSQRDSE